MEKILYPYPTHPVRCIITWPTKRGKTGFLANFNENFINEIEKIYIYSPSLHQDLYQKILKCSSNYIPIHIIPKSLNVEDIDKVSDEAVNNEDFEKSDTEMETYESIEEVK